MKLFEIKCPNCNATLNVTGNRKNMTCEYCQAKFILDDETVVVKHINAGEISEEQEFVNAETNLNILKDYEEAYKCYYSLSKRYVDNKEIWLGMLRSYTHDFTNEEVEVPKYTIYWKKYKALATEEEITEYEEGYNEYDKKINNPKKNFAKKINNVCNVTSGVEKEESVSNLTELIVTVFLGPLGVHKFMKGQIGMGILYLCTAGLFYIGWIIDIVKVVKKQKSK